MECFIERNNFLTKYKDQLDFVHLSRNCGVTDYIRKRTPYLPWSDISDEEYHNYIKKHDSRFTLEEQDKFNYIEFLFNPHMSYSWKNIQTCLEKYEKENKPIPRYALPNLSRNRVFMKIDEDYLLHQLNATLPL